MSNSSSEMLSWRMEQAYDPIGRRRIGYPYPSLVGED